MVPALGLTITVDRCRRTPEQTHRCAKAGFRFSAAGGLGIKRSSRWDGEVGWLRHPDPTGRRVSDGQQVTMCLADDIPSIGFFELLQTNPEAGPHFWVADEAILGGKDVPNSPAVVIVF